MAPSPYLPVTRRFVNPIYIRVEDIDEFAYADVDGIAAVRGLATHVQGANHSADLLDRDATWTAKREALEIIFAVPRSPGREAEFRAFMAEQGEGLLDFGTWCTLVEEHGQDFTVWPEEFRDPHGEAIADFRATRQERIDFFCWLQWVADAQLATCQQTARSAGMRLGILHDLAVGVHPKGADAWALQDVMASGVTVGHHRTCTTRWVKTGRNRRGGRTPWRMPPSCRTATCCAPSCATPGPLRLDHVLGLFRLWWIPKGMPAYAGTFVKFDHEALVNILVLEAHRAGAVLIGEDLGTVEDWVKHLLAERGILGTRSCGSSAARTASIRWRAGDGVDGLGDGARSAAHRRLPRRGAHSHPQ